MANTTGRLLEVNASLPADGYAVTPGLWDVLGRSSGTSRAGLAPYHHCRPCGGYVPGEPVERRVNTLGPLSGRCGVEHCCRRCGYVLHFDGMMS